MIGPLRRALWALLLPALLAPAAALAADTEEKPSIRQKASRYETGRQRLVRRLAAIRLPVVQYDDEPLPEVINRLREELRGRDPEKRPFNFLYVKPAATPPKLALQTATMPAALTLDWDAVVVRQPIPLRHLTALQVLDVITKAADPPIRFAVDDYAIVVLPVAPGSGILSTGVMRANPDTFQQGLQGVTSQGAPVAGVGNP
jgi:hypothetical protein